ncbi:MAG TPA: patatin-like phospholipase family protein [Pseudonocardia sp.]|nr:patatin-like phospholipase family protein [Pseudonocardia sp.]
MTASEAEADGVLRADLVLSGGGVKGVSLAGAAAAITEAGYRPQRISGTSAGGIVGAMIASGLVGEELGSAARAIDYASFLDPATLDWVPLLGSNDGIYRGEAAREWIAEMLAERGVRTFADLADPDPSLPPERRYKLVVTCADLTLGRMVRLPWDYRAVYGLDPDEQAVADAVRASMSVPLLFQPVKLPNRLSGKTSTLVDGGIVSNFPIDSLDRTDGQPPRWPTFGVTIMPDAPGPSGTFLPGWLRPLIPKPVRLLEEVAIVSLVGRDQAYLNQPPVRARAITVDSHAAGFLDFHLSAEQVERLYDDGYQAGQRFLASWDWQEYLRLYRPERGRPT